MNLANFIFYILLFIGFFLPTNSNMYIPLPGVLLKVNELAFLLLPIVNLFCTSKNIRYKLDRKVFKYIILYLFIVFITEFLFKPIVFNQSFGDSFKAFRLGLPLYSSLLLLLFGIKADIRIVWKVLLYAIGCSVILSLLSLYISLPIYYNMEDEDILAVFQGRIMNSNAAFGIIGLYLLFTDKNKWYNRGKLVKYVSILSIIALLLAFNRTYLALLVLEFIYLSYKTFSLRTFYKILLYPLLFMGITFFAYNSFDAVQRQIDKRILSIVYSETTIAESTIEDNRDFIYEGIENRFKEGYWIIGLPYDVPIFEGYSARRGDYKASKTDVSFVNIILRYGALPFVFFIFLLLRLNKMKYVPFIILLVYVLASLNLDALFNHNSIFFLIILSFIYSMNIKNLKKVQ